MTHPAAHARRGSRVLALVALSGLIAAAAYRLDLARAVSLLGTVRWSWIALAVVCYATILPLWAAQWRLLAPRGAPVSRRDMLGVVAVTSAVLNTTPLLVGEATAVVLLVVRAGLDRASALSVLAMDQLLVGLAKLCVFATAAFVAPLPDWMTRAILAVVAVVFVVAVLLVAASWRHVDVGRWTTRALPARVAGDVGTFAASLEPLRALDRGVGALALALLKKAVEVCAIVCVQRALGVHLPIGAAVVVLAVLNLATLLPVVPGNIGVFEAAVVLALTGMGVDGERALGVAVVQHLCYFVALALPGLAVTARGR